MTRFTRRAQGLLVQACLHREAAQNAPPIHHSPLNHSRFGKIDDQDITWELTNKADALKKAAK